MAGYELCDKKSSSDIREQLGIFDINDKINSIWNKLEGTYTKNGWRQTIKKKIMNLKGEEI